MEILSLILTIIALIYSYSQRRKRIVLVYDIVTREIINQSIVGDLMFGIDDKNYTTISHTRLIIRNEGERTLYKNNMYEGKLYVSIDEGITNIASFYTVADCNKLKRIDHQNEFEIEFESLDYNQEIIVDIYHTGLNSNIGSPVKVRG